MVAAPAFDPADPDWLAHRYERTRDEVHFRHWPRTRHGEGPFLTDELVGDAPLVIMPRADAVAAARRNTAPVRFIFHSAFCASTLLVRAFDRPGLSMGLSEPMLLNDIVGIRRRGEMAGAELARLIDEGLALLSRRRDGDSAVVIKPSNIVNSLSPAMLALRPDASAVLLYAPLRQFLSSVARKGLWCRLWVRELLEGMLREGAVDLGFEANDYFRMTDLQVAAVGWLAQHRLFAGVAQTHDGARVATLDSDRLLDARDAHVASLCALFGLPDEEAAAIAASPAFTRHSKHGAEFSAADRLAEKAAAEAAHGDEIAKVHDWALAVAANAGVDLTLPSPLGG